MSSIDEKILNHDYLPFTNTNHSENILIPKIEAFLTSLKQKIEMEMKLILDSERSPVQKNIELRLLAKTGIDYYEKDLPKEIEKRINYLRPRANIMAFFLEQRSEILKEEKNCRVIIIEKRQAGKKPHLNYLARN